MSSRLSAWCVLITNAIPALLSFVFFRITRALLKRARGWYFAKHPEKCTQWQVLDGEFISKPLVLPLIMTGGPRWNTHALIGTLGPIDVEETLAIDVGVARESAGEWFFVLYSYPDHTTIHSVSSVSDSGSDWEIFTVAHPGKYVIGARYYHPREAVVFPAVRADRREVSGERQASAEANKFYTDLRQRETLFYRALSYYVYPMLRCRALLPEKFVRNEFLPVGNPETVFLFNTFKSGEPLTFSLESALSFGNHVYVTLYSRASFPLMWFEIDAKNASPRFITNEPGFYLIRIQKVTAGMDDSPKNVAALRA